MLYNKTTTFAFGHMRKNAVALDLRLAVASFRLYSTVSPRAVPNTPRLNPVPVERELTPDKQKDKDAEFRKRKTEWKRRQGVRHTRIRTQGNTPI